MNIPVVNGVPFRSKEVSWLAFNARVLQEAADASHPLLERLRFLGIYASNLDEFFRVRIATLRRLGEFRRDFKALKIPDPNATLKEALRLIKRDGKVFEKTYTEIFALLHKAGVHLIDETKVPAELRPWLSEYFHTTVRPHVMPVMIRSYTRLAELADAPMYLAVQMSKTSKAGKKSRDAHALVAMPTNELPRFITLPPHRGQRMVMFIDDIIRFGLPSLFRGLPYDSFRAYAIKFTRDAEMELDADFSESLSEKVAEGLKSRQSGQPVRMSYDATLPASFRELLVQKLRLGEGGTLMPGPRYQNRRDLMKFPAPAEHALAPLPALEHPVLSVATRANFFRILQDGDVLLHLPWHSFSHYIDFLREASIDPLVSRIQMTQYRVARHSCVARALMAAAQNGKDVSVVVEPRARFDEQNNIDWAHHYQEAGVRVVMGVPGLKVHAKLCLVTRHEGSADRHYAVISTGNFNEDTARYYTDHLLFTAHPGLCADAAACFQFFQTTWQPPRLQHFLAAPFNLRTGISFYIQAEIANARLGRPASVFIKLNNLADPEITALLYQASEAGVRVRLIVRSMFSVIPGKKHLSRRIEAVSIVDHYLEHSRVFLFENGGQPKCFLSSADFLPRNFESRFEIVCPILDETVREALTHAMELQWRDNVKARVLDSDLKNQRPAKSKVRHRSQLEIRAWLSRAEPA
jgi:polyphosphate kinase